MDLITKDIRGLLSNRLFQFWLLLTSGALASLLSIYIGIRLRWIDVVELGLSQGIDRIGRALAPLYLAIYGSTSLLVTGVAVLIYSLTKAWSKRVRQEAAFRP
jgi:hypothetical protein